MRAFIDPVDPSSTLLTGLPAEDMERWSRPSLPGPSEGPGPVGSIPRSKPGRSGLGQLELALMSEIIGRCMMSMTIFGAGPGTRQREHRTVALTGRPTPKRIAGSGPNLRGEISSVFALTEPFLPVRIRLLSDESHEGRRPMDYRWSQLVHHQRLGRRHRARARRDQPRGRPHSHVGPRRPHRHARYGNRARHRHHGAPRRRIRAIGNHAETCSGTAGFPPTT